MWKQKVTSGDIPLGVAYIIGDIIACADIMGKYKNFFYKMKNAQNQRRTLNFV